MDFIHQLLKSVFGTDEGEPCVKDIFRPADFQVIFIFGLRPELQLSVVVFFYGSPL